MADVETLQTLVNEHLSQFIQKSHIACQELTIEISPEHLHPISLLLRDLLNQYNVSLFEFF